jgi:UDP-N-acetylglucosamine 1-carboxyvinyltransferase
MPKFIITGKRRLQGRVKPAGNKNAALPMLAACLLTDEELILDQVPDILDVRVMLDILSRLGVEVDFRGNRARLCAHKLTSNQLDEDLCTKVRSSILCAGPLAARHGRARFFPPGGDIIGHRRLDTHFIGLQKLGFTIAGDGPFSITRKKVRGTSIILDEASVTGTENIMMAATLVPGRTEIYHAACEPHVQDLGRLLISMGANIEGLGTNRIIIHGVKSLGGAKHRVAEDYVEIGSYLAAAAATRGSIEIGPIHDPGPLHVLERSFHRLGVEWNMQRKILHYEYQGPLRIRQDVQRTIPKIEDGIWPAFPSDLMSVAIVLATQCRGSLLFFEKLFESRMYFVDQLIGMGAQIVQCDPHRVLVNGPSPLQGGHISSPDIRAGMALIIAALSAKGPTTIENVQMIDRGYERLDEKLNQLNARVERID